MAPAPSEGIAGRPSMRRKSSASNLLSTFSKTAAATAPNPNNAPPSMPSVPSSSSLAIGAAVTPTSTSLPYGRDWDAQSLHSESLSNSANAAGTSIDYLRDVVHKRMQTLTYLRSIHMGKTHWINTILPSRQELEKVFNNTAMRKRTYRFAILGMSLSNTFDVQPSHDFLRAIITTLTDFDQFQDGNDKSKIRFLRGSKVPKRQGGSSNDYQLPLPDPGDTSYLMTPHMPYPLDYSQTLLALIDILSEIYQKISRILGPSSFTSSHQMGPLGLITPYPGLSYLFAGDEPVKEEDGGLLSLAYGSYTSGAMYGGALGSPPTWNPAWAEMVNKIDSKFKKIITMLTKELDAFARNAIKDELASLDPLLRNMAVGDQGREQYDFEGAV